MLRSWAKPLLGTRSVRERPTPPRPTESRSAPPIRLVVAVQPALWCELLSAALGRQPGLQVIGSATREEEIQDLVSHADLTVVLIDYEAMGPNTEGVIARLRRSSPRARVVVLARRSGEEVVRSVLRAGAGGLVGKEMKLATLVDAIGYVGRGQVWANRAVTAQVIEDLLVPARASADGTPLLTKREWEVLDAVSRGLRNLEIARLLGISERTVKTHLNNMFAKTRQQGRFALALWAQGQIEPKT